MPYTHLFCARREGLQDRMTHVHARSDCVLTKEGRSTLLDLCVSSTAQVCLNQAWYRDTPPSLWTPCTRTVGGTVQLCCGGATRTRPGGDTCARHPSLETSGCAPTLVIVGQTSARFTAPLPPWRPMDDSRRCCPHAFHVFEQMRQSVIDSLLKVHSAENSI